MRVKQDQSLGEDTTRSERLLVTEGYWHLLAHPRGRE
jgi:hypothetical protein